MSVSDSLANMSPDERRALLQQLLEEKSAAGKTFPMSQGQQGLWYTYRRDPDITVFNFFLPSRVRSELDLDALREAIEFIVGRHPCLRTTFSDADGQLLQHVHDQLAPEFTVVDARQLNEDQMRQRVIEEVQRPFELETGPLLRLTALQHRDDDFVIIATSHHIVVDFWSLVLILGELRECYPAFANKRRPLLPPASGNYAEFVHRQQEMLAGDHGDQLRDYWRTTLDGAPTVLEWTTDYERPASFTGRASVVPLKFPPNISEQILRVARQAGTTINAVVLAAVQTFIWRYTRQEDFLVGSPFLGRDHAMFESTVGFFANMLPLRADLSGDPTFAEAVQRAGRSMLGALEHQSYPLELIVRNLDPPRDPTRSPLFQASCTFEKSHIQNESGRGGFLLPTEQQFDFAGLHQESYYIPHPTCFYDVEFVFEQTETELRGMMVYCRDLFAEETATQMARNFESLLLRLLDSPESSLSQISWDVDIELSRFQQPNNDPTTLVDLLDDLPARHPDAWATCQDGNSQSHGQLIELSRTIARQLCARGIEAGDMVPVAARQGPEAAAAMLGVLRAGAAVVPIDTDQPNIAMSDLIADTGAKLVIVDRESPWSADDHSVPIVTINDLSVPDDGLPWPLAPMANDLAYMTYTSGSTGRPNGVLIEHHSIVNLIRARHDRIKLEPAERILLLMSHQFDAGFASILIGLTCGACIVWPDSDGARYDFDRTIDQIHRDQVSIIAAVPSWFRSIITHGRFFDCGNLSQIWCGGESMPPEMPELVREQQGPVRIWNFYGPTETTVEISSCEVRNHDPRRRIPIGTAIPNTGLLVVDEQLRPVPDTVPGQLTAVGFGLARGYLNQPELTRQKFVPVPANASGKLRMYLTGDLCRRLIDGQIEFLGRIDNQVKVRGYRIELEEVESVLQLYPEVANAAATVVRANTPAATLVAFVTRSADSVREPEFLKSLHRYLADQLPDYKRPALITVLDELPMGPNGKVSRRELPEVAAPIDGQFVAPSTPLERHLANEWCEMLGLEQVGVNQNFFELGGNSLQAAMMTSRLSEDLGVHVPTALLFDLADIAGLAHRLSRLYEPEMKERFGRESVISRGGQHQPFAHLASNDASEHCLVAPLQPHGNRTPVFMVHPPGGIVVCYRELAEQLSPGQPLFAIRSRGLHGKEELPATLEAMAADYIDAIKSVRPDGPYVVGGWSLGGLIAYEIAQQLLHAGDAVQRVVLLDTTILPGLTDLVAPEDQSNAGLEYGIDLTLEELIDLQADQQLPYLWQHAVNLGVLKDETPKEVVNQVLDDLKALFHHHIRLTNECHLQPLDAEVLLIRPRDVPVEMTTSPDRGWGQLVRAVQVEYAAGHHHSMVQMPQVRELAQLLEQNLRRN